MSSLMPLGANKTAVKGYNLSAYQASALLSALHVDAADCYYSAWVTFLDAVNGASRGFYSWATVKAYYSLFYSLRAALAHDGICAFYVGRSHYLVEAKAGAAPTSSTQPGTHKTVLKTFQQRNPAHLLLSQKIDVDEAVDWLMERREWANYSQDRFSEPECTPEFKYLAEHGIRQSLSAYLKDSKLVYPFDPEHATIAYPLCALREIGLSLSLTGGFSLSDDEQQFLKYSAKDKSGALSDLIKEFKRLKLVN